MGIGITSVFRRYCVGLVALLLVAACSGPQGPASYRDQGQTIAATTRFDVERFWGAWHVRETFPSDPGLREVSLLPDQRGGLIWREARERCNGSACATAASDRPVRETGTGRLLVLDGSGREMWVLWVDADFRTAAIGTPDGRFGYILDRRPIGGADRIAAAREVMDFNGYDISQLKVQR